ncbi:DUF1097 domain-containing protein [Providencia stuartii]|uniref:DUF1097 domain-containing protein n=1 Tax=Providencia stuartii TaxID=588 RepID=UPI002FD8B43D
MKILFSISLTTAILSAVWAWLANSLGLIGWAGFLGCTAYFAYPKEGIKGLFITFFTTASGVAWGLIMLHSDTLFNGIPNLLEYLITGIVAFMMCIQARQQWLSYIPGTFIGACDLFASQGEWTAALPSLLVGVLFGYLMKKSGLWLSEKLK